MGCSEIAKIKWFIYHKRERTPLLVYFFIHGSLVSFNSVYNPIMKTIASCVGNMMGGQEDWGSYSSALWDVCLKNPQAMLKYMRQAYAENIKDRVMWRKLLSGEYNKMEPSELLKHYEQYVNSVVRYGAYAFVPLMIEKQLAQLITDILKDRFKDSKKYENLVMTPLRSTATLEEKLSFLNLAIAVKKMGYDSAQFKRQLKKHVESFSFLKSKGMFLDFHDEEYYLNKLKSISNPTKARQIFLSSHLKFKEDFNKLLKKLSPKERTWAHTLNEAIFFRSWRSEALDQSSYYAKNLFTAIAKNLKLDKAQDVLYLYPEEVEMGLINPAKLAGLRKLILERRQSFAFFRVGDQEYRIDGQRANELLGKLKISDTKDENILRGRSAFRGLVRGSVAIVLSKRDYKKIEKADILVTDSTLPDMVPYMKKIKAIVAEEGSVLSHASVISRELKIPAVIGVAGITKVLKDGDKIEVDAEKGVIKKI